MRSRTDAAIDSATSIAGPTHRIGAARVRAALWHLGWAGVALALLFSLHAGWRLAEASWLRLLVPALVVVASLRPRDGLLVLAGLGPLAGVAGAVAGTPFSMREMLVLATFTGWAVRVALVRPAGPTLPTGISWPLITALVVIVSSLAVELYGQRQLVGPAEFRSIVGHTLDHGLLRDRQALRGLNAGLLYLEGLAIFAVAAALCARHQTLARQAVTMAIAGAAGAALLNIQRIVVAAYASAAPLERLRELLATVRVSVAYRDVNAAGSYFALMFFPAGAQILRASGWRRMLPIGVTAAILAAAWLSGSRAAVGAILAVALLGTVRAALRRSWRHPAVVLALVTCLVGATAFVTFFPNAMIGTLMSRAVQIRVEMARISLALLAGHPLFGVGVGGFYDATAPLLASSPIGIYYQRENAHNNGLQWLAELGLVGFAAFVWLLWAVGRQIARGIAGPTGSTVGAVAAGLLAFALTAMLGHPLLTPEVNHAFWLMLGIACGASAASAPARAPRLARGAAALTIVLAIGLLPWRFHAEASRMPLEHVRYGASLWETDPQGVRYQTFIGETTLFVPSVATAVDIPLRLDSGDAPVTVEIRFRNRVADRLSVTSESWHTYRLIVGSRAGDRPYLPVHLHVTDDDGRPVRIGRSVTR